MKKEFIPVLMGNDINVYSMARAFFDEYRIRPVVFCKNMSGPCQNSDILSIFANEEVDNKEVFLETINSFAQKNMDKNILLIGCGDNYVEVISKNLDNLECNVVAPYMPFSQIEPLTNKENFYKLCEQYNIPYPKTHVVTRENSEVFEINIQAPFVAKPADSVEYWRFPFDGQDKVFIVENLEKLQEIINNIFQSGYNKEIIVQEYIPGNDTNMRVLTCFSGKNGKVQMMALGHVLLEEHTPKGIGNHAVILNEYNEDLSLKYKYFLEQIGYVGFSNFDIKFDSRDGQYKAFELNPRQGRSNYYVTNSGYNLAKLLVDEYLNEKPSTDTQIVSNEKLWMVVPHKVAFKYVALKKYQNEMHRLICSDNWVNPLLYSKDKNIIRKLRIAKNLLSHFSKFKKYYGGNKYEH